MPGKDSGCAEKGIKLLRVNEIDFNNDPSGIFNKIDQFLEVVANG